MKKKLRQHYEELKNKRLLKDLIAKDDTISIEVHQNIESILRQVLTIPEMAH